MLKANFHTHSRFCDGTNTIDELAKHAVSLGFEQLGFSGHMDPHVCMDWPAYVAEVRRVRELYRDELDVLLGVELDNAMDPSCCPGAEYVIGSTHFLPVEQEEPRSIDHTFEGLEGLCREFYGGDWYALTRAYYDFEAQVLDRTRCTFVGHFDLVTRFNDQNPSFDESDLRYLGPALEAMEHLVSRGVPFEINCGAVNRGRKKELYPRRELLRKLHDFGGEILINADAHQKELLNGGFDQAVRAAMECEFTHINILAHDSFGGIGFRQIALDTL